MIRSENDLAVNLENGGNAPQSELHRAALQYAAKGTAVFPVRASYLHDCVLDAHGKCPVCASFKQPACARGFKDATTDPEQINAWWTDNPNYNIGHEPARSGRVVVDIDDKGQHHGSKTWSEIYPEAPETLTVRTPSGGLHLYFTGTMASSAGRLGDGLDIRGIGGYVLLPPSSINGVEYTVVRPGAPVAPLPAFLAEIADKPKREPVPPPEHIVVDPEGIEAWVEALIKATIAKDGPAEVGAALNQRSVLLGGALGDGPQYGYAPSLETVQAVAAPHWSNADRVDEAIANGYRGRENPLGCGQAGSASRKYDPIISKLPGYEQRRAFNVKDAIADLTAPEYVAPVEPEATEAKAPPRGGLVSLDSFKMERVNWIWFGWLAAGKLHILGGQAGGGNRRSDLACWRKSRRLAAGFPMVRQRRSATC